MFLILLFINWSNLIMSLPLVLEILSNMCIAIVCIPGCDIINFEINLIFLTKPFSTWPKSQDINLNILRTKRDFKMKKKAFFIIFKGLSVAKNCFRPESVPIMQKCL